MKNLETKYFDAGLENQQLYHNTGINIYAHVGPLIWQRRSGDRGEVGVVGGEGEVSRAGAATIAQGPGLNQRVLDSIQPTGMKLRLWMSNTLDRCIGFLWLLCLGCIAVQLLLQGLLIKPRILVAVLVATICFFLLIPRRVIRFSWIVCMLIILAGVITVMLRKRSFLILSSFGLSGGRVVLSSMTMLAIF